MMPTIDRAVVYDIYDACIRASRILDVDADMRSRLERDILRLPPLRVGADGALMEWQVEGRRTNQAHRHASHLVALYPLSQISPERTPLLAAACDRFLELQTKCGWWEDTEWTRGNMINFYARLKNAGETYQSLMGMYERFVSDNLMSVSPQGVAGAESDIFSFDGNEAAVSGICEALLQSYDGYLDFLPALPREWSSGSVRGICARGGIEADITWRDGKVVQYTLHSPTPQTVICRINGQLHTVTTQ
jgi:alpha-L-fucosidase 2